MTLLWLVIACGTGEAPVLDGLRAQPLTYTRHARCRMACRDVTEAEVGEILAAGRLDPARTRDGECPSYAVEGVTSTGQHLRVVVAGCATETRVVTTVDLDREWPCDCD